MGEHRVISNLEAVNFIELLERYSVIVALKGLPIRYSVIVALTGLPIGYSVIVALTGLVLIYGLLSLH